MQRISTSIVTVRHLMLFMMAGLALPQAAAAQEVVLQGAGDAVVDRRLRRLLEEQPRVVAEDALIGRNDTVAGSVLVLDATLIVEGTVLGDVVAVDAGVFVRPPARIRGDLVGVAGGLYVSELARIGGAIVELPAASYRVVRADDRIVIEASGRPSRFALDGAFGFGPPTYDRVNGLTATWGAAYWLPALGSVTPSVYGRVGWATERGEPVWQVGAALRAGGWTLAGGAERTTLSNETWIREPLDNSLGYAWNGKDYYDHYAAERRWAMLQREFGHPDRRFYLAATLRGQVEDARSLRADDPWVLWGVDSVRVNPAIDDGRITSAIAAFALEWRGHRVLFEGDGLVESAHRSLDGDHRFDRWQARGELAMAAILDHAIEIEAYAQAPLPGTDSLPRQRRTYVGGSGTLQTFRQAAFRGDHVVFVETKYIIPLPRRWRLPLLGPADLQLLHAAGRAWLAGEDATLEQNVGVRLQFALLYLRYMIDPAVGFDSGDLDVGVSWPFRRPYPWQP